MFLTTNQAAVMNLEPVQALSQSPHKQLQSQRWNDGDLPVNFPIPPHFVPCAENKKKSTKSGAWSSAGTGIYILLCWFTPAEEPIPPWTNIVF